MSKRSIFIYDDGVGAVELIDHMGNDLTVVNSARVSFGHEHNEVSKKDEKLIKYLIQNKHTSTLEHNVVTFRFTVPLFIRSQHHRHRTWSYNEVSRRYTEEDIRFYEPSAFRSQHKSNRQASNSELIDPTFGIYEDGGRSTAAGLVRRHHMESLKLYETLLDSGVCREQARGVLPQNLYTQYYGTANLNNILKFVDLRLHEHAQWEIQKVAQAALDIVDDLFPVTVQSYRLSKLAGAS